MDEKNVYKLAQKSLLRSSASREGARNDEYESGDEAEDKEWMTFKTEPLTVLKPAYRGVLTPARQAAFEQTWSVLESTFESVLAKANTELFNHIRNFARHCESSPTKPFEENVVDSKEQEIDFIKVPENDDDNVDGMVTTNGEHGRDQESENFPREASEIPDSDFTSAQAKTIEGSPPSSQSSSLEVPGLCAPTLMLDATPTPVSRNRVARLDPNENDEGMEDLFRPERRTRSSSNRKQSQNPATDDAYMNGLDLDSVLRAQRLARQALRNEPTARPESQSKSTDVDNRESAKRIKSTIGQPEEELVDQEFSEKRLTFLPTAVIVGNQDTTDNEILLTSIAGVLSASSTRVVLTLNSGMARTAGSLLESIATRLPAAASKASWSSGTAESTIVNWCQKSKSNVSGLWLIVEDFESFQDIPLRKLVNVMSYAMRRTTMPVMLVIGVSSPTNGALVASHLDREQIRLMSITVFRPRPSLAIFDDLFERLFEENPAQIIFTPRVLEWFNYTFTMEASSISLFKQQLKFAVLHHFAKEELAFLCVSPKSSTAERLLPEEWARDLIENRLQVEFSLSSAYTKENQGLTIENMVMRLTMKENSRRNLKPVLQFVRALGAKLSFLGESELSARHLLTSDWKKSTQRELLQKKINASSRQTLEEIRVLAESLVPSEYCDMLFKAIDLLRDDLNGHSTNVPVADVRRMGAEKRRATKLMAAIRSGGEIQNPSQHRHIHEKIFEALDEILTKFLSPRRTDLQIGFVFDNLESLNKVFRVNQTDRVLQALLYPCSQYLGCDCCAPDKGENESFKLTKSMDDIVIAFKTLQEVGDIQTTNLRAWYDAFANVVRSSQDDILAKFVRSACELSYLGIWKGDANENVRKLIHPDLD